MASHFLDTNIIIRYLTRDHPTQSQLARQLIAQLVSGQTTVVTGEGVIVEVVQVLSSKALYNLPRADIRTHLRNILAIPALKLSHKRTYLRALDLYAANPRLDFVDALNVAHMERLTLTRIVSFDRDFDRIAGVTRSEPPVSP